MKNNIIFIIFLALKIIYNQMSLLFFQVWPRASDIIYYMQQYTGQRQAAAIVRIQIFLY